MAHSTMGTPWSTQARFIAKLSLLDLPALGKTHGDEHLGQSHEQEQNQKQGRDLDREAVEERNAHQSSSGSAKR